MLEPNWLVHNVPVVKSTQDYAKTLVFDGAISDRQIVVTTNQQTDGHGQYGRKWSSIEGNLHISIVFPVEKPVSTLTYIVCLAIGEVILSQKEDLPVQYKWVNDVLINDKKVAGVLTEHIDGTAIIGIGVNLIGHPDVDQPTTNLSSEGIEITEEQFIEEFLNKFVNMYNSFLNHGLDQFAGMWKSRAYMFGENISIDVGDKVISGRFVDIDENGQLIMQRDNQVINIQSGAWVK